MKKSEIPDLSSFSEAHECIPVLIRGVKGSAGQVKNRITLVSRAVLRRVKHYHSSKEYRLASAWLPDDVEKPAFLTANQLPWSLRNASKQFKKAVRRIDAPAAFSTHWLRHGTAFSILRSDVGKDYLDRMLIVMTMLGHSDVKTSYIYTQISPAMLSELTKSGHEKNRLHEAEEIRQKTYLPPLKHKEGRGHSASRR